MSHQVEQQALIQKESNETDAGALKAMKALQQQGEVKHPEIVIKDSDIKLVIETTHLSRNAAIDLINSTNGDIKEALRKYVTE